jgi:hypothetical protein
VQDVEFPNPVEHPGFLAVVEIPFDVSGMALGDVVGQDNIDRLADQLFCLVAGQRGGGGVEVFDPVIFAQDPNCVEGTTENTIPRRLRQAGRSGVAGVLRARIMDRDLVGRFKHNGSTASRHVHQPRNRFDYRD